MKRAGALLIALVLVLSACGDDDADSQLSGADAAVVDDLTREILEGTGTNTPISEEEAACFAVGLVEEFGAETMVEAVQMDFEDFMAQASTDDRLTVVDTMLDCVDFGAAMAAEMGDAVSAEAASCLGDAFMSNDAFRAALADSFGADAGDPFENDELLAAVFPSILECLSPEELVNLGGLDG